MSYVCLVAIMLQETNLILTSRLWSCLIGTDERIIEYYCLCMYVMFTYVCVWVHAYVYVCISACTRWSTHIHIVIEIKSTFVGSSSKQNYACDVIISELQ